MYRPEDGRFMQPDPIGYDDGLNIYAYVGNDPVNGWDPTGLSNCVAVDQSGRCTEWVIKPQSDAERWKEAFAEAARDFWRWFNTPVQHDISGTSVCWKACGRGLDPVQTYSPAQQAGTAVAVGSLFGGGGAVTGRIAGVASRFAPVVKPISAAETAGLKQLFGQGAKGAKETAERIARGENVQLPAGVTTETLQKYRSLVSSIEKTRNAEFNQYRFKIIDYFLGK